MVPQSIAKELEKKGILEEPSPQGIKPIGQVEQQSMPIIPANRMPLSTRKVRRDEAEESACVRESMLRLQFVRST